MTGEGSAKFTSEGAAPSQDVVKVTAELNPLIEVTVIVAEPVPPWVTESNGVNDATEKSGVGPVVVAMPVGLVVVVVAAAAIWTVISTK